MQWDKQRIGVGVAVLIALGAAWWIWGADRDARQINRQFDQLVELLEKRADIPPLRMMARARRTTEFFTDDAEIRLSPLVERALSVDEIPAAHHLVHSRVAQLTLRISDRHLDIDAERQGAVMRVTVRSGVRTHQGSRENRLDEFRVQWVKEDGTWLIQSAEIVSAIRAPRAVGD